MSTAEFGAASAKVSEGHVSEAWQALSGGFRRALAELKSASSKLTS